jgi:signal transduction histidine kinase
VILHEFITLYREAIIARTRAKLVARPWPSASTNELDEGVPLFLSQLSETLKGERSGTPFAANAIGASAAQHGGDLLALGFTLSEVVHAYGDICQAVTELAIEQRAPITPEEFHTLNRCLDTAIAEAVTAHGRLTAARTASDELKRSGHLAHEIRDRLNTAVVAFDVLKRGTVAMNGSTGAVLGRSLLDLRDLVANAVADVRLAAEHQRRERVLVSSFLKDIALAGALHAEIRGLEFVVQPVNPAWALSADNQLLGSAVTNLLNNAFKFTRAGGRVVLRARAEETRLLIEVEDECGGIPAGVGDAFQPFGQRRGADRTGLGLGLSIARNAVRAHGGDIHIRDLPGKGCVFTIAVPLAVEDLPNRDEVAHEAPAPPVHPLGG